MSSAEPRPPYYRDDLAMIHHVGFAFHADACAPGIIERLKPVRARNGLVVELGCGSGLLTRPLVEAGHRVLATDASPAMLDLARAYVQGVEDIVALRLPDDPIPPADAIVSVGHVVNYLDDDVCVERALVAIAEALRPGGIMAIDLCDLEYGRSRMSVPPMIRRADGWLLATEFSVPTRDRFVRQMTTFVKNEDDSWRRDDERHDNVLIDAARVPVLLAQHGVEAAVEVAFGEEVLPVGLVTIIGRRRDG
ncbi:MAG TPA: class I SAM-dependent methyltransferase [Acidimicrobiales bacterium]|nr:class I SAM-dependent methyltransferase [Acidimicrobiales bacterium]